MLVPSASVLQLQPLLACIAPRNLTGEKFEELLAQVLPKAVRLKKDKRWFDVRWHKDGIECKTYLFKDGIFAGSHVDNVLKRVSQVQAQKSGQYRPAADVGRDILTYLQRTVQDHAAAKKIIGQKLLVVLARSEDHTQFAYWEEPLDFGNPANYQWAWTGKTKETLTGTRNGQVVFTWYQKNQKQLFYRWRIPKDALIFAVQREEMVEMPQAELLRQLRAQYERGYADARAGRPAQYTG